MARMNIAFSDTDMTALVRMVPPRHRSAFVVAAVREKLARQAQERAVQAAAGAWSGRGRGDPTDQVRAMRAGWKTRLSGGGGLDG